MSGNIFLTLCSKNKFVCVLLLVIHLLRGVYFLYVNKMEIEVMSKSYKKNQLKYTRLYEEDYNIDLDTRVGEFLAIETTTYRKKSNRKRRDSRRTEEFYGW